MKSYFRPLSKSFSIRLKIIPYVLFSTFLLSFIAACSSTGRVDKPSRERGPLEMKAYRALKQEDYPKGIQLYEQVVKNDPSNAEAFYYLGYGYGKIGMQGIEILHYQTAIDLGYETDEIYRNLGFAYLDQKMVKESIATFQKAIHRNPKNPDIHFDLGLVYMEIYKTEEAIREFETAVSLRPDDIAFREQLGLFYLENKMLEKAAEQFQKMIELDPDNQNAARYLEEVMSKQGENGKREE